MSRRLTDSEKLRSFLIVTSSGVAIFAGINLYQGNERFYREVAMPLARFVDPEKAHNLAVTALKWDLIPRQSNLEDGKLLRTTVWGLKFENPLGMAAGFDKQGEVVKGLTKTGFGFVEIGSVTPKPQFGNPKPRVFRLVNDNAIINRYGFNSEGHEAVWERLKALREDPTFDGIIGVNLGKNKISEDSSEDYIEGIKKFSDVADYLVINVSSPNTAGLRNLQNKKNLEDLLCRVNEARKHMERKPPLLLKLAPDLSKEERKDIVEIVLKTKCKVDGLVLSNTTVSRENLVDSKKDETGGLSGAPLTDISTAMISEMYKATKGKIPIIGVGGIFSGQDAYEKIKAGASLIQIYTSYTYHGPPIVSKIKRELIDLLKANGHSSLDDAVGKSSL
ncbi:dihydroorotate dehydrogenase (quinone), mitochondrial isoform X1 [Venturia canescens]|uniref:dihydroorotate dehydrogenase (quinone), mitochondrial isoform X1 n=2 Tax=Venturia canescens TaxID=32260 RepID=UPI001C9BBE7A|nr:dihydroorotate dehydrogenase (quinone), mitochondrial isoform X1 [Venturia canescens]XP_043267145.1 dihydroorotate dehydrogenase (quinone), mitochondrial isoform X1 [Venturia canescens]